MSEPLTMVARSLAPSPDSQAEMFEWKRLVSQAVAANQRLELHYFGGANQISAYRLFYMLQHAKRAGSPHVALLSDGLFWSDEATDWLAECGVDEVVLETAGELPPPLAGRVAALAARTDHRAAVILRPRQG